MNNIFITRILIDKLRHLSNLTILLSENERRHLIITGKNDSGKTSVLEALREYIKNLQPPDKTINQKEISLYFMSERTAAMADCSGTGGNKIIVLLMGLFQNQPGFGTSSIYSNILHKNLGWHFV
jgi:predicted ATP-binding protein involved in virulence